MSPRSGRPRVAGTLAEMGVLGIGVSEAHGGLGMAEVDWVLLAEETGYAALPHPFVETACVVAPLLDAAGDPHGVLGRAARRLPPGRCGPADQRPGALGRRGDLPGLARPQPRSAGTTAGWPGVEGEAWPWATPTRQPPPDPGRRRRCRPPRGPPRRLAGGRRSGAGPTMPPRRSTAAPSAPPPSWSASAAGMLDLTVAYVGERKQFGVPIGSQQAVKHHLADAPP